MCKISTVCVCVCQRDSLSPENRIHSNCRLIQDEKFWILKERRSQRHPALLTTTASSKKNPNTNLISRHAFSRGGWLGGDKPA